MNSSARKSSNNSRFSELRTRLLFVFVALIIYRVGSYITLPGVNASVMAQLFQEQRDSILGVFNLFSGGSLERMSIFALGIMPYISASIIVQMMSHIWEPLKELRKEGESGRRQITKYTRYLTLVLALFQSIGIANALPSFAANLVVNPGLYFVFSASITLVTGTMFLVWLGEQITERGVGNGISLLIFAGIVAGLPSAAGQLIQSATDGQLSNLVVIGMAVMTCLVICFVVFMERAQRRITVSYAQRQQRGGRYSTQSSHLPLKINMAGVIPPIFASSIILFPSSIARWASSGDNTGGLLSQFITYMSPGQPIYVACYALAIIFFCFFYTALVFNSRETADNLKKQGAFIPGIRPGEQTARYIDGVLTRLTVVGALYITLVCLIPEFLILGFNVPFYFGGTSLLIVVVVIMDFMAQIQTYLMSQQYEGLMKKANLKGYSKNRRSLVVK